jgi:hypothetical protein
MKNTVLIVAPSDDLHAQAVSSVLNSQLGALAVIWDSGAVPADDALSFRLTESRIGFQIKSSGGNIALDSLRSIWWRRPKNFRLDDGVTDHKVRQFCLRECSAFLKGILNAIDVPILNDPTAQPAAARKPLQLTVAQRVGLAVPKTLMSNDAEEIRSFWEKLEGNCIYKAFTAAPDELTETRRLTEEDLKHLGKLRHAPIIAQEKIEKGIDIRVNIFGESVFGASVITNIPEAELDCRLDLTATWKAHTLPDEVAEKLILLLRRLGLHYGCIDLRQQPDGTYVFLEVNPAGQFLFIEIDTGQPLTRTFAELLLQPTFPMAKWPSPSASRVH